MSEAEEVETVAADLQMEFYYHGRETPIQAFSTFRVPKRHLDEGDELMDFMSLAAGHMVSQIDTVGTHRLVLGDNRHSKQILLLEGLQSVSMLAPDEETILAQIG